jgi:hypothetical protein
MIEAVKVIAELIELAKQMREGQKRRENLGLNDDEIDFDDALEVNDSSVLSPKASGSCDSKGGMKGLLRS